jgi:hypothetical protein
MILVDAITEKELNRRFDGLPEKLKEALTSERNLTVVNDICQRNRIADEEKTETVRQLVALVILGVVHYYDIASEINESLSLNNPKFSGSVADELNAKIFAPLKAELENNYHPLIPSVADVGLPAPKTPLPIQIPVQKPVQKMPAETKPPVIPSPPPPKILSQVIQAVPIARVAPPPAPKPSDAGWSKSTPEQPVVKLNQAPVLPAQSAVSSRVPPPAPKPATIPIHGSVGEFERMAIQKGAPQMPAMPQTPAAPPAPVIIHEDASFRPAQQPPSFHLPFVSEQFNMPKGTVSLPMPTRPAVLELGNAASGAASRVVHYTEYKSPSPATPVTPKMPPAPPTPQGSRQITEITPQSVLPQPPKPPASNMPTAPLPVAAAPQTNVIYKNYSEPPVATKPPLPAPPPLPPKPNPPATKIP